MRVKLPYTNADRFAEIRPLGGDVDFYKFSATAGDVLVVETVPGNQVDTLIGLFDAAGTLLAVNDDGGAFGLGGLSRLAVIVPATANYFVGVTTWPDFGFTGAGQDFGRYVRGHPLLPRHDPAAHRRRERRPAARASTSRSREPYTPDVFVNGNGNLTFGAADGDFSETVAEFLGGPAAHRAALGRPVPRRRAGDRGTEARGSLTIHFASVPEFFDIRPNYFSLKLERRRRRRHELVRHGPRRRPGRRHAGRRSRRSRARQPVAGRRLAGDGDDVRGIHPGITGASVLELRPDVPEDRVRGVGSR